MCIFSGKRGITLIEVLVVIGVVGVLVIMLLVAVPRWRESTRTANCTNNMKQIGLGLLNYESLQKHLPGSAEVVKSNAKRPVGGWSFLFKILPNMDYGTIYNSIYPEDIKGTITDPVTVIPLTTMRSNKSIANARDTQIYEFICPSNPNSICENPQGTAGTKHEVTNYKGLCSVFFEGFQSPVQYTDNVTIPAGSYPGLHQCDGALYPTNDGIRLADITDGASHTILCGETKDYQASSWIAGSDVNMVVIPTTALQIPTGAKPVLFKDKSDASYFALPGFNGQYYGGGNTRSIITFFSPLEYETWKSDRSAPGGDGYLIPGKDSGTYPLDPTAVPCQLGTRVSWFDKMRIYGPSSGHPSVINCLFGDGSVRGVRKDVDAAALFFAVTRNNHDPAADDHL